MFKNAIVKKPARSLINGITSSPKLGTPDYEKALIQHRAYIAALKKCGVEVLELAADESYPDSCFVEDVAVCTRAFAMVTAPGAPTRKGEEREIAEVLSRYYDEILSINAPGTLEGGDVMMVGDHFYIGLSNRTNREGARQLIDALEHHGMSGSVVKFEKLLHLKTGITYMENKLMLAAPEFTGLAEFKSYRRINIPGEESYAANCIRVNDYVIVPSGYPKTRAALEEEGLKTLETDTSEFRKIDGGLSCLSLRF